MHFIIIIIIIIIQFLIYGTVQLHLLTYLCVEHDKAQDCQ